MLNPFLSKLSRPATSLISKYLHKPLYTLLISKPLYTLSILFLSGFIAQASFLVIVGYTTSKELAIVGLTLAVGLGGFTWSGFPVNHLDIAPRYAGILFGVSNCLATIPGIFSPMVVGILTPNEVCRDFICEIITLDWILWLCEIVGIEKRLEGLILPFLNLVTSLFVGHFIFYFPCFFYCFPKRPSFSHSAPISSAVYYALFHACHLVMRKTCSTKISYSIKFAFRFSRNLSAKHVKIGHIRKSRHFLIFF